MENLDLATIILAVLYAVIMFTFTVTFFVMWILHRKQVRPYRRYGFAMGIIFVAFELVVLLLVFRYWDWEKFPLAFILITDFIAFFRICAFTIVGIYYCTMIGLASFPLLMWKFGMPEIVLSEATMPETEKQSSDEEISGDLEEVGFDLADEEQVHPIAALPYINLKEMAISILAVVAGGVVFSVFLFWITKPQMTSIVEKYLKMFSIDELSSWTTNVLSVIVLLSFAFAEEIVFRLGIQNFFAKNFNLQGRKYWWAILLVTIIWSIGHVGVMEPGWVKMVQVFPLGLMLGWLFKRYGVESSIIAHGLFNVILWIPSEYLISS